MTLVRIPSVSGGCVTEATVLQARMCQGFELGVTAFGKLDLNSATVAETHFHTRIAETPSFPNVLLSDNLGYI